MCDEGCVRLVNDITGTPNEGRVEVCYSNTWSTVCDYNWGPMDAKVVCKQLGFSTNGEKMVWVAKSDINSHFRKIPSKLKKEREKERMNETNKERKKEKRVNNCFTLLCTSVYACDFYFVCLL